MLTEPQVSADLSSALKERLRTSDQQGEIELYYKLLGSGHSVGEILNAVSSIQSKSEYVETATAEHPQSGASGEATGVMPKAASVDKAQVHAPCTSGLSLPPKPGSCRTEKPQASEGPLLNEFRSVDWIQLLSASLHARRGKFSITAKQIAFLVVCIMAVSSAAIAGFLIMRGGRDAKPTTYVQSNVSSTIEDIAAPSPAAARSEPVAGPLIQNDQVGNAGPSHAPKSPQAAEPASAFSSPAQEVEAGIQTAVFSDRPEAEASQESEPDQPDGIAQLIEQLDHQAAETSDPTHEPLSLVVQSLGAAPAGSAETVPHSNAAQSG